MANERDHAIEVAFESLDDLNVVEQAKRTAGAFLAAGYRRVTTDPETVDKIAKALHADDTAWLTQRDAKAVYTTWDGIGPRVREDYRRTARAALSALTGEETSDA